MVNASVAATIYNMVDFGGDSGDALVALCAALFAIVTWATAAWWFGIPTSESHALIAGISGAAIALHGGLSGINGSEWIKVVYGLGMSTLLGFGLGWLTVKTVEFICRNMDRRKTQEFFRGGQIAGGASGIYNTLQTAMPQVETGGSNGSFLAPVNNTHMVEQFYKIVDEDIAHRGRPLCELRQLNTLSGFILCAEGEIDISCYDNERKEISRYLTEGFFWE
jgi:phosphate/sulfate permease